MTKNTMEKNHSSHSKLHNNQITKPAPTVEQQIIGHFNRIITTQDHLNDTNFNLESFINIAAHQAQYSTHTTGAAVELINGDYIVYQAAIGSLEKYLHTHSDKNNGISGLSLSTHQVILSNNCENDPRINLDEFDQIDVRSLIVAPIFQQGNAVGVIKMISTELNSFSDIEVQSIRIIAGLIGSAITYKIISENAKNLIQEKTHALDDLRKSEKKLKNAAHHDYLTTLPNRNLFNDQLKLILAKAKRRKQLIALMYLDIDRFKDINDTHGHMIGDKLLRAFGLRLKQCVRSSDVAARIGGDEFTLLIDDIKDVQDSIVIAEKVLQSMRQPFHVDNLSLNITTSIGISLLKDNEITPDDFIKQADQALYVSKSSGRNTFYVFDNELLYERITS